MYIVAVLFLWLISLAFRRREHAEYMKYLLSNSLR